MSECEDREVQGWIEATLAEELSSTDLFEALRDGTVLCRLLVALQNDLQVYYHALPSSEEDERVNLQIFFDHCEEHNVPVYFSYEDLKNRENLNHILSTICVYGEEILKFLEQPTERAKSGSLTKQSGEKNMRTLMGSNEAKLLKQGSLKTIQMLTVRQNDLQQQRQQASEPVEEPVEIVEETPEEKREKQKKKQTMVLAELMETEKSFVTDLELLVKKFLTPVLTQQLLSNEEADDIFINIRDVWVANRKLLKDLDTRRKGAALTQYTPIADIFVAKAEQLLVQPYSLYCCNHNLSLEAVERLKKKKKEFADYLFNVQMNDPDVRGLDLISFLVKPVQRICKYPLLFRELLKQAPEGDSDIPDIKEACKMLELVVDKVNANKRISEGQAKIAEYEKNILLKKDEDFTFVAPGRTLLKEADLKKRKLNGEVMLHAVLLTDLLILTKTASSKGISIVSVFSLDSITVKEIPDTPLMQNSFEITTPECKTFYTFASNVDKGKFYPDLVNAVTEAAKHKDTAKPTTGKDFDITDNNQLKLLEIRKKLQGAEGSNLLKVGRTLLKQGEATLNSKGGSEPVEIFLFNDIVLLAKLAQNKDPKKKPKKFLKKILVLENTILTDVRDTAELKNCFHLVDKDKKKAMALTSNSLQDKISWVNEIKNINIHRFCKTADEEARLLGLASKEPKRDTSFLLRASMSKKPSTSSHQPKVTQSILAHAQLRPTLTQQPEIKKPPKARDLKEANQNKDKDKDKKKGFSGLFGKDKSKDKDKDKEKEKERSGSGSGGGFSLGLGSKRGSHIRPSSLVVEEAPATPPSRPLSKLRPTPKNVQQRPASSIEGASGDSPPMPPLRLLESTSSERPRSMLSSSDSQVSTKRPPAMTTAGNLQPSASNPNLNPTAPKTPPVKRPFPGKAGPPSGGSGDNLRDPPATSAPSAPAPPPALGPGKASLSVRPALTPTQSPPQTRSQPSQPSQQPPQPPQPPQSGPSKGGPRAPGAPKGGPNSGRPLPQGGNAVPRPPLKAGPPKAPQ